MITTGILLSLYAIQSLILLVFLVMIVKFNSRQHEQFSSFSAILMEHIAALHQKVARTQTDEEIIEQLRREQK